MLFANLKKLIVFFTVVLILFSGTFNPVFAKHKMKEKEYQKIWCDEAGGTVEVIMPDGTRCDCLTEEYAIEFDFGPKWCEAIGQSLNYALQTNKKAGIVLILESQNDYKFWIRLNTVIDHFNLPVKTWMYKNY